jgi:hypothetical protein
MEKKNGFELLQAPEAKFEGTVLRSKPYFESVPLADLSL